MNIRLANNSDIDSAIRIINDAKELLRESGSPQWNVDSYPNKNTIQNDIENNNLYVITHINKVIGIIVLILGEDESYKKIDGSWLTKTNNYLVIHRLAIKKEYYHTGVASKLMEFAIEQAKKLKAFSIRVDTHKLNSSMQGLLKKYEFTHCGTIELVKPKTDKLRLAYEKILS